MQAIVNKFNEFELGVEAGTERFNRVDSLATELIEKENPNSTVILPRQEELR